MPKVCANLSEIENEILKSLKIVEGEDGEKLKNLLRYYISTTPELKSSEYALKRVENKALYQIRPLNYAWQYQQ